MITYLNFINGNWRAASDGAVDVSRNPANGEELGYYQNSTASDVEDAVFAASQARAEWSAMSGAARGDCLYRAAEAMEQRLEEIAATITREMGKTLAEAKGETMRGIQILRYYAGEGMRKIGDVIPSTDADAFMYTTRVPLGVVGVITPWNFPLAIPLWKLAPALVYGNCVVLKPSELSAVTAVKLVECLVAGGFPAGVVNLVTGKGSTVGETLVGHPQVVGISFTGSNAVGKKIGAVMAAKGGKYQLEMGGKNPLIVLEDADLQLAVDAAVSGGMRMTGQKCTATSRVIVQESIYDVFKAMLLDKVSGIQVGDGSDASTWMGPCISGAQLERVLDYVRIGVDEGATLLYGGQRLTDGAFQHGHFVAPALFEHVTSKMTIAREEIFGPVLVLI